MDSNSGLQHIVSRHGSDFAAKHNISSKRLPSHLKNVVSKGTIVRTREIPLSNGKIGYEKIYSYKGKYYTLGAIGTNGYIVSMYPIKGGK